MMNYIVAVSLLLVVCFRTSEPGYLEQPDASRNESGEGDAPDPIEEKMKELRIEMVKFQILSKLKLKGPPPKAPTEPSEFSREAIRLLLQESEIQQPAQFDSEERLIIHAKGKEMECVQINDSTCRMFRYELSLALNSSSMDLWIYRLAKHPKWVSVSTSFSSSNEEKPADRFHYELKSFGWNKLQLPRIFLPSSWNDSAICSVEIKGPDVEHRGDRRPFLLVSRSSLPPASLRQRRDVDCDTNESCCLRPLRVSFAEIGFNWVLYPVELEANMCAGRCRLDHSSLRTHYERAMSQVLRDDSALRETLGECWALCCKPEQLEPVRVIYNDTDGIIHDQYITELSVKSCSCS